MEEKQGLTIAPEFIVTLKNKDYPLFAGVLDCATRAGLRSLRTTVLQIPGPENGQLAVVMARAEFEDGRVFEDVGDASPVNCSPQIATAALRMASTRAKGRVLRDAVNIGQTLLEELPDLESVAEHPPHRSPPARGTGAPPAPAEAPPPEAGSRCSNPGCGKPLTKGQHDVSLRSYGQPLCPACQRLHTRLG